MNPDDINNEQPGVFDSQVDYKNRVKSVPNDISLKSIDTDNELYSDLDYVVSNLNNTALSDFDSFPTVSQTRNQLYDAFDTMCEDSRIAAAIDIYTNEATEPNDAGQIVWCEADDANVSAMINYMLDSLDVNKYAYMWMYSLVKYGDAYLKLYRESEFEDKNKEDSEEKHTRGFHFSLNEDLKIKAFKNKDHIVPFVELNRNPAELFELQKHGKTVAYVKTELPNNHRSTDNYDFNDYFYRYNFDMNDVELYPADGYVHACLDDTNVKYTEEVILGDENNEDYQVSYTVRRGKSLLYDVYKIWKTLSLLENAILLNRLTKSSIVKVVEVETGDMDKGKIQNTLQQMKSVIEQKAALDVGNNFAEYMNTSPTENLVFTSVHEGKGAINVKEIGGDKTLNDQLNDLDYFKTKLYAALGIPKQYLGDTDDSTGFNGGTALSLISSQFAKRVKRLQNALISALTDAINLMLIDKGLYSYVNRFTLRMQSPSTQEEKDRRDISNARISAIRDFLDLVSNNGIEEPTDKLKILMTMLKGYDADPTILEILSKAADKLEQKAEEEGTNAGGEDTGMGDIGGGSLGGGDLGGGDLGTELGGNEEEPSNEEQGQEQVGEPGEITLDTTAPGANTEQPAGETPMENFYQGGGARLNEQSKLPSWDDLHISWNNVNLYKK